MASNDPVVSFLEVIPPATLAATPDIRAGGSTPAESVAVYDFNSATTEYLDYKCHLSDSYDGGGLTFTALWSASTSTATTACVLQMAIRRFADDAEDIDAAHTYDYNGATDAPADLSGEVQYSAISFTSGADMDSLAAGEMFFLRVRRNATATGDAMGGDMELIAVVAKET